MKTQLISVIVLIMGLVLAVILGSLTANQDYESISGYFIVAVVIYFVVRGWRNVWWFTTLLIFTGVVFSHGFIFEAYHLFGLMICLATILSLAARERAPRLETLKRANTKLVALPLWLLLLYAGAHFAVYYVFPYDASRYNLKTSLKAYVEGFGSMFCLAWLLTSSYTFRIKSGWVYTFIGIIIFGVAANALVRGYMFATGFQAADGLTQGDSLDYFLYVPVINMQAGVYTLREICPIATAILAMIATTPGWWRGQGTAVKSLMIIGALSIIFGSLFSGGRAVILFCLAIVVLVLLYRKMVGLFLIGGVSALVLVALINIFSTQINESAPLYVSRSLQFLMLEKGDAGETISDSQYAREAAFSGALDEWRADDRTLFFGRSVFSITYQDADFLKKSFGVDGFVMAALISGRSHNLLSDLLLQYGIVGATLYLLAYLSVIWYFYRLVKVIPKDAEITRSVAGAMLIYLPLVMIYQLLGGQFMPIVAALCVGLIRADLIHRKARLDQSVSVGEPSTQS